MPEATQPVLTNAGSRPSFPRFALQHSEFVGHSATNFGRGCLVGRKHNRPDLKRPRSRHFNDFDPLFRCRIFFKPIRFGRRHKHEAGARHFAGPHFRKNTDLCRIPVERDRISQAEIVNTQPQCVAVGELTTAQNLIRVVIEKRSNIVLCDRFVETAWHQTLDKIVP